MQNYRPMNIHGMLFNIKGVKMNNTDNMEMASFNFDLVFDEVADHFNVHATVLTDSDQYFAEILLGFYRYRVFNDGIVKKVVKTKTERTGGVIWNGDDEYFNEVREAVTLSDSIGQIEGFSDNLSTMDGLENIAVQVINIITDYEESMVK
jgi:hypothetical protein